MPQFLKRKKPANVITTGKKKKKQITMSDIENDNHSFLSGCCEILKGRLYFNSKPITPDTDIGDDIHCFVTGDDIEYLSFFKDFGPFNLAMIHRYCEFLNDKLHYTPEHKHKKIVHCILGGTPEKALKKRAVNAAFLIGTYAIVYLNRTAKEVISILQKGGPYIKFRDASYLPSEVASYMDLSDTLKAVEKAHKLGFFNFDDFNYAEYEHYEQVHNGDLNLLVPDKFLAFRGPAERTEIRNGYPYFAPDKYFDYFKSNNVSTIIRLNAKFYEAEDFVKAGFKHEDLFFRDGSTPCDEILKKFLRACEESNGMIAVHCKAGLGRTGTLIACYMIKHYKFTAMEAIAWLRICRPGSVIGNQQNWVLKKESLMLEQGRNYPVPMHNFGVYSIKGRPNIQLSSLKDLMMNNILEKVDTIGLNDETSSTSSDDAEEKDEKEHETQGDRLNKRKSMLARKKNAPTVRAASEGRRRPLTRSKGRRPQTRSTSHVLRSGFKIQIA
ncbi:dual specificity protein phosphatase CDC14C-like [Neocloeon triangulifer]|uniref:dual specificity protein phosphatase CDC14C-like n=1 Tax=Neocloeon triangulifer TaxID=2078957 RepID=UPI00286ECD78|nr:dual specificity protein phosphatase CDC14C-like [Neocloeon triangulifer]